MPEAIVTRGPMEQLIAPLEEMLICVQQSASGFAIEATRDGWQHRALSALQKAREQDAIRADLLSALEDLADETRSARHVDHFETFDRTVLDAADAAIKKAKAS